MLTRAQVNDIVKKLPEEFSVDQSVEKLVFIDKVKTGLSQSEQRNVNTNENLNDIGDYLEKDSFRYAEIVVDFF